MPAWNAFILNMEKIGKTRKKSKAPPKEKKPGSGLQVDETGETIISDEDPDILPPPDEELETTPPYEPPLPAEGP